MEEAYVNQSLILSSLYYSALDRSFRRVMWRVSTGTIIGTDPHSSTITNSSANTEAEDLLITTTNDNRYQQAIYSYY